MRNRAGGYVLGISLLRAACSDTTAGCSPSGRGPDAAHRPARTSSRPRPPHSQPQEPSRLPRTGDDRSPRRGRSAPFRSAHVGAGWSRRDGAARPRHPVERTGRSPVRGVTHREAVEPGATDADAAVASGLRLTRPLAPRRL